MKINITAKTDVGKVRHNNEDAFAVCPDLERQEWMLPEEGVFLPLGKLGAVLVVADGMGGENAGEVASAIAVDTIRETLTTENVLTHTEKENRIELLKECIKNANDAINKRTCEDPNTTGMGTTIVICWIVNGYSHIVWCGDTRCYLYHPGAGLKALTKDHSYVQELIDQGEITQEQAFLHPDSNIITRAIGNVDTPVVPDTVIHPIKGNDILLLCSDGLCGCCRDRDIQKILDGNHADLTVCGNKLISAALNAGGYDNICIALASLIDDSTHPIQAHWMLRFLHRLKTKFA